MSLLHELVDKADQAVAAAQTHHTFEEARAALTEAGMARSRRRVDDALQAIDVSQAAVRSAHTAVRTERDHFDQAVAEVEWELDAEFVAEGNKTFLVLNDADGEPVRKQMTADERRDWKTREAAKNPRVRQHRARVLDAEAVLAEARDGLTLAEKQFTAARIDLEAAIATVTTLAASIRKEQP